MARNIEQSSVESKYRYAR